MRKILLLLFLINVYASYAQDDVIHLGYCNGEMAESSNIQLVGTGWVQSAIYLPASTIKTYAGNEIKSIRAGLVSRLNIDTLRVWIRTSLEGENIVQGTITKNTTPSIARGWNEILLDQPYSLTNETSGLYIGYSYRQRANVQAVSIVGDPVSNASYLKMGNEDWKDMSSDGVLSIEAVVTGNSLPHYDLGLSDVRISPDPGTGENALKVVAVIHNYGTQVPDGFNITCQTPGINPITTHFNTAVASSANSTVVFDVDPGVPTDNANLWTVKISSLDHNVDENESNNTFSAEYTFLRNVLVEEFTTENCVNCPRVASFFRDAMERNPDYKNRICPLCHHAGYYTDWLTQPCDNDYLWLYNEDGNYYAPSMMINRRPYFKGMFATNNTTATFLPESADELQTYFDSELNGIANAVVGARLDFNADSSQVTENFNCL